jgi:uncharacterized protein YecT (DUF1311 family)
MPPLFVLAMAAAGSPTQPHTCLGNTTPEVNSCLGSEYSRADADLNKYYKAAIQQARTHKDKNTVKDLINAQRAWITYRDSECHAAVEKYRGGTIANSMETSCLIRTTRIRTYLIWRNWLTFVDSTPPLLPRPDTNSALSDGRG